MDLRLRSIRLLSYRDALFEATPSSKLSSFDESHYSM